MLLETGCTESSPYLQKLPSPCRQSYFDYLVLQSPQTPLYVEQTEGGRESERGRKRKRGRGRVREGGRGREGEAE